MWYHIILVNDGDHHTTSSYAISNNLRPMSTGIHGHWAHIFLRSFKYTLYKLFRSYLSSCDMTTYNLTTKRKYHLQCTKNNVKPTSGPNMVIVPIHTTAFKICVTVPKKQKDIIISGNATGSIFWWDSMKKEFSPIIFINALILNLLILNHLRCTSIVY